MIGLEHLGRTARALLIGVVACVSMAACATVPITGPVVPSDGGDSANNPYGGYVRLLPAGPQPGFSPQGLVSGFLKDMGSFEEDHKAARSYMLPDMGEEWSPNGSVKVFADLDTVNFDTEIGDDGLTATVRMRSSLVATIDESGKYIPSGSGRMLDELFFLAREDGDPEGEWRIQSLPGELILSQLDVERTYRPFNMYYFNPAGNALVPDPIYLPVSSDQLAERLLRRLMRGPSDWLDPAVDSAFPEDAVPSLTVDAERAVIEVADAGGADEFDMGAQIAWTLRQLPEIEEFTLELNGTEVEFPGSDGESAKLPRPGSDFWAEVSPGATSPGISAYYMHEGQLWSASGWDPENFTGAERVPGPLGAGDNPLERFAVSIDESTIAGIALGGGRVVKSSASPGAEIEEVLSDGIFTELSWDVNGDLWVVEETGDPDEETEEAKEDESEETSTEDPNFEGPPPEPGSTALWTLRDGDEVVRVDVSGLSDTALVHFQISRDGTRAAVVTEVDGRRMLQVGRVVEDADGQIMLGSFITLAPELHNVTDLAWRAADQLVVLGSREGGTSQAFLVSLDGGTPPAGAGTPVASMVTISGAPGQPLVAGSDDGNIWVNARTNWQNVVEGASPAFPG